MSRRNFTDELDESESRQRRPENESRPKTKKNKRRRLPWLLVAILALAFFLPNLVGWLGLHQQAVNYALSDFNGTVSVETVSLSWFRPVALTNVVAIDSNGNTLFLADSVRSAKPLYSFLTSDEYGQFDVAQPVVYLQLRPDGSNLEDALAKYIGTPGVPNATPTPTATSGTIPKLTINVIDGQAVISTTTSTQTWKFDGLNAVTQLSADASPLIVDLQCRVTPLELDQNGQTVMRESGALAFTTHVDAGQSSLNFNSADLLLETANLPLSLAAPVLQRFVGPANTTGTLNGKFQATYQGSSQSVGLEIDQLNLRGFGIVAPELIGSDQFLIEDVSGQGTLQLSPSTIAAQQFKLNSDVGNLQADGSFDVNQLTSLAEGGRLLDTPFQMDGKVDLARLFRMLPATFQLHKDLIINSGTVTFQAGSRNENGIKRMVVNLDTANISARRGAQNIDWAQPLRLVGTIRDAQGKMAMEEFRCISDFLTVVGSADLQTGSFVAQGDLNKLMRRVGQFVDLQGTKLSGELNGKFGWQVQLDGSENNGGRGSAKLPIQIGGNFDILNPMIQMPGMQSWQQQSMSVKLTAAGTSAGTQLQLDQGGIQVDIGSERMVAQLAQPVADAFTNETWNFNCQATGSMTGWLEHLQNFVDFGDVAASGQLALNCGATLNLQSILFTDVAYSVEQLEFNGYGLQIREPKTTGTGSAVYDLATGNVEIPETTILASSLSARGQQLRITFPSNMQVEGHIAFKADVNRIADWYQLSPTTESIFWYGGMDGTIQLVSNENGIGGRVNASISDLIAAKQVSVAQVPAGGQTVQVAQPQRRWQEVWREPSVTVRGDLSLANDFNTFGFSEATIDCVSLKAKSTGSISDLGGAMFADLSGTWIPNWEKINSLLQACTGDLLKFAGQGEHQFVVRGPLFDTPPQSNQTTGWVSPALQSTANFGWERGEIFGLAVGQSKIEVQLENQIANVGTSGIPFSGGTVQMSPKIDLRGPTPIATLQTTRIIDNVALQPETARQWLKYVAPLAADATSAQGNFTVDVKSAVIPVFDPMKMEIDGAIKLSNVVIGAGPAAEQLLGTVNQLRALLKPNSNQQDYSTWLQMSEQSVPVVVKDGRIFHDNVKLAHRDLLIQTRGSVGFDQSLSLVAEVLIADDWIAGKSYLAGLKGKSISIPIGGTITKPVLDRRAVQQLSQDLVKQAAGGLIDDQIKKEREKLLGRFGEKLGLPEGGTAPQPGQPGNQPSMQDQLEKKAQSELIRGIGNLFGK